MNIVLMAGGGGTRLWPLSRKKQPKQFLDLGSGKTLLEHTYDRARALTDASSIYVATMEEYGSRVKEILSNVPEDNVFYEPERRDNAAAFAAVSLQLQQKDQGQEPTIFFWCDHIFTKETEFIEDAKKIPQLVTEHPDTIVIAGHIPTYPEPSLGYIEAGEKVVGYDDVYMVKRFTEKPDLATATKYIEAGNYFWNMGAVTAAPDYLLQELTNHQPEFVPGLKKLKEAFASQDKAAIASAYGLLPKTSIDYAVLEHTPRLMVVTGDYGWSDVGNWKAVQEIFGVAGDHMPFGHHVYVDAQRNYIYNTTKKVVSLIDIHDSIVVVTHDAVLVTSKTAAAKVKDVVVQLENGGHHTYL